MAVNRRLFFIKRMVTSACGRFFSLRGDVSDGESLHQAGVFIQEKNKYERPQRTQMTVNETAFVDCPPCSYGPYCQFHTDHYGIPALQSFQRSIESFPTSLVLLAFLLGTLWNALAIGTFCQSPAREMGTGIYRLWISITGQIALTIVITHLLLEKNHIEAFGCYALEYLRKVLHALFDSLTACTMLERTMVIFQSISFNKQGSRRVAKRVVPILVVYHFASGLPESFYRRMTYSSNQYWCTLVITHPLLRSYQSAANLVHLMVPFTINLCLPCTWIIALTVHKSTLNRNTSIWTNLKNVLCNYHLMMISCYTLVLLNLPRVVFTLRVTCIQSRWQYVGYFLSLVPMAAVLFIFVLPSPKYRSILMGLIGRLANSRHRMTNDLM